jgi:hypothetical protein
MFNPKHAAIAISPLALSALFALSSGPALAQLVDKTGSQTVQADQQATGAQARQTDTTGGSLGWTYPTGPQNVQLPRTSTAGLAPVYGGYNGLPPTVMDSFVQQAGGLAFQIYGDEGTSGPPPISGFNRVNRIDSGIQQDSAGLTTGHGSVLPSAWGADEFIGGPEMSVSGDHQIHSGQGPQAGYPLDPGDGLPGGSPGGGYYDQSGGAFPNAGGN